VIVGGSAHTIAMGSYTQGGGHSPMSRMFGLAIDNLLEVEIITADGSLVIANENETHYVNEDGFVTTTDDTDIFWANFIQLLQQSWIYLANLCFS